MKDEYVFAKTHVNTVLQLLFLILLLSLWSVEKVSKHSVKGECFLPNQRHKTVAAGGSNQVAAKRLG